MATKEEILAQAKIDFIIGKYAFREKDGSLKSVTREGTIGPAPEGATLLDEKHQQLAEKTAAMMMLYSKIISANPEERGIIAKTISGLKAGADTANGGLSDVAEQAKKAGLFNVEYTGQSLVQGIEGFAKGLAIPLDVLKGATGTVASLTQHTFTGTIQADDALAIGVAFASARQATAEGHKVEGFGDYFKGLLSRNFGDYFGAGAAWLIDQVCGLLEMVPGLGDWIKEKGWHKGKSLAECVADSCVGSDNKKVEVAFTAVPKIGSQDPEKIGKALANGGNARGADGQKQNFKPGEDGAPKPSDGSEAPTTRDEAALRVAAQQKAAPFFATQRNILAEEWASTKETLAQIDSPAKAAGATVGTLAAGDMMKGVVDGTARTLVGDESRHAKKAAALHKASDAAGAAGNKEKAAKLFERSLDHEAIAESRTKLAKAAHLEGFVDQANAEKAGGKLRAFGNFGRWVGDKVGTVADWGLGAMRNTLEVVVEKAPTLANFVSKGAPVVAKGAGIVGAAVQPTMLIHDVVVGDGRGIVSNGTGVATIAASAGAGFLIGGPPGALVGAVWGGFGSIATSWGAGKIYDRYHPEPFHVVDRNKIDVTQVAPMTNEELAAASAEIKQQLYAQTKAALAQDPTHAVILSNGVEFRSVTSTQLAALKPEGTPAATIPRSDSRSPAGRVHSAN